jgi:hypothetical protein
MEQNGNRTLWIRSSTGVTMVAETVYHSQAPEFAADFSGVRVA